MIVVSDTSVLSYLVSLQLEEGLRRLYGRILIPSAVESELLHPSAPPLVRAWMARLPEWIEVRSVRLTTEQHIHGLDPGETEAIYLAERVKADRLILDDAPARAEAARRGLPVIGTLRVLEQMSKLGFVDLATAIRELRNLGFRVSDDIVRDLLRS